MMWTTRSANELYVWRNGVLIYKRWDSGYSKLFDHPSQRNKRA